MLPGDQPVTLQRLMIFSDKIPSLPTYQACLTVPLMTPRIDNS